jgi:hypothetical protein
MHGAPKRTAGVLPLFLRDKHCKSMVRTAAPSRTKPM